MELEIGRLQERQEAISLAPALAELQEASPVLAPHCRPVSPDEISQFLHADERFDERTLLIATQDGQMAGWCHLEPPQTARTAGDIYPLVGGQAAFQPGLPFVRTDADRAEVIRALIYAACQTRAQQGARDVELFAPDQSGCEPALRAAGLQPADAWATYLTELGTGRAGRTPVSVAAVREAELETLPQRLRDGRLLDGEFTTADLRQLIASFPGFEPQGLLLAHRAQQLVGYAAVMIDPIYGSATGRKRAWMGLGPLGMGTVRAREQEEWLRAMVAAASISAFCRGAAELAFVGNASGRQPYFWSKLGFEIEVRWRRWRIELERDPSPAAAHGRHGSLP